MAEGTPHSITTARQKQEGGKTMKKSWAALGWLWAALGRLLGGFGRLFGASGRLLGCSCAALGRLWAVWIGLGPVLEQSWVVLGRSWNDGLGAVLKRS